jgi:hypothetical protein
MNRLSDQEPILVELYDAITYFFGRQQLVIRAVLDMGIDPSTMRGASNWAGKAPQKGIWGIDWKYFFHGGGCQLTSLETGEPINWEGPDTLSFSSPSLAQHIEWRVSQRHHLPHLAEYLSAHGQIGIFDLVNRLIKQGIIAPDQRLLPLPTQASAA